MGLAIGSEPITMLKRICGTAATLLALAGSGTASAQPEFNQMSNPSPHCVTGGEMDALDLNPAVTRTEMERQWGVDSGDRVILTDTTVNNPGAYDIYLYPACGKTFDEVQVIIMTERKGRAAYTPKPPGRRIVISGIWWKLPDGYVCGDACT